MLIPRSFAPSWFAHRQSHRLLPSTSWSYTSIVLSWCFIVRLLRIVTVYKSLLLFSTPSFIFISMTFISPVLVQIVRGSKSFVATLIIANIDSFIVFWSILVVKYTIMQGSRTELACLLSRSRGMGMDETHDNSMCSVHGTIFICIFGNFINKFDQT